MLDHNLQQLHQVMVISVLNGNLDTAIILGEEYLERTAGLEGRL